MPTRVVLGAGRDWGVLLGRLAEAGDVVAVVDDAADARRLAERDLPVERADPSDPAAIAGLAPDATSVVVATADPERAAAVAGAARDAFPTATILAPYVPGVTDRGSTRADRTVDPSSVVAGRVLDHVVGEAAERALALRAVLLDAGEPLAVVMHDNPDPDAIASAVALAHIAAAVGVQADPCYFGTISHQENRALVNLLDLDLRELEDPADLDDYAAIALVDHARPGVNDQLPADTDVDVVIDHHPTHGPDRAAFVDLRSGVGATSTLLTEYFDRMGVDLTRTVATALLYGLRVDTDDFRREAAPADFEAAATLVPNADESVLERVESPSLDGETMAVLARAIERRQRHGGVLTAFVGEITQRDALAQAADRLLDLEGVTTTVVFGVLEGTVYASARARGAAIDLGEVLRTAFDQLGSAGGHADMAGAQIPVGMLVEPGDPDPDAIVEEVLTEAFLEAVETTYAPVAEYDGRTDQLSFLAARTPDVVPRLFAGTERDRDADAGDGTGSPDNGTEGPSDGTGSPDNGTGSGRPDES